ncbi:MAG: hypothetical protein ACPLSA_07510 [Caldanaerobacter sp.]
MRLKRTKERKERIRRKRLVIFALLLYIFIVIAGLLKADYNFYKMLNGEGRIGILRVELCDKGIFMELFGKKLVITK